VTDIGSDDREDEWTARELVYPAELETTEVSIGTGSALTLTSKIAGLGTSFLVGVFVARMFGVAGKGALSVMMQVPGLLVVALDLGISTSLIYFVSRGESKPGTAAANSVLTATLLGALGAPLIWLLLSGPLAIIPNVPIWATLVAMAILPLSLLAGWMGSISVGLSDLRLPLWYAIVSSATTLGGLAILLATGNGNLTTVMAVSAGGTLVGILVFFVGLRKWLVPFRPEPSAARKMAGFSAKAYLTSISGLMHERQDVLLLGWLAGTAAVGLYSVSVAFAEITWYIPGALSSAILAKGSRRSEESTVDYTTRTARVAIIFMLITIAGSLLVVPWLIPLVYGSAFAGAMYAFFALTPGILADGVSRILWSYQITRGRMYWEMAVGTMVLNIAVVIALVPALGAVGAALASSVSYSILAVLVVRRFCSDTGSEVGDVLVPRSADVRIVVRTAKRMLLRRRPK
jgi:O-antigen/teichoic acid export membrane protein